MSLLASSIMAPGSQETATKYGITNATVVALTLSIFPTLLALRSRCSSHLVLFLDSTYHDDAEYFDSENMSELLQNLISNRISKARETYSN